MARARAHFGRIDILVNNVGGISWARPYEHTTSSGSKRRSAVRCSRPMVLPCRAAAHARARPRDDRQTVVYRELQRQPGAGRRRQGRCQRPWRRRWPSHRRTRASASPRRGRRDRSSRAAHRTRPGCSNGSSPVVLRIAAMFTATALLRSERRTGGRPAWCRALATRHLQLQSAAPATRSLVPFYSAGAHERCSPGDLR
jgi:hypothetical protein